MVFGEPLRDGFWGAKVTSYDVMSDVIGHVTSLWLPKNDSSMAPQSDVIEGYVREGIPQRLFSGILG